jgi:hypothetical protein
MDAERGGEQVGGYSWHRFNCSLVLESKIKGTEGQVRMQKGVPQLSSLPFRPLPRRQLEWHLIDQQLSTSQL